MRSSVPLWARTRLSIEGPRVAVVVNGGRGRAMASRSIHRSYCNPHRAATPWRKLRGVSIADRLAERASAGSACGEIRCLARHRSWGKSPSSRDPENWLVRRRGISGTQVAIRLALKPPNDGECHDEAEDPEHSAERHRMCQPPAANSRGQRRVGCGASTTFPPEIGRLHRLATSVDPSRGAMNSPFWGLARVQNCPRPV